MATITRPALSGCDGFHVEAGNADVGTVEETWLDADGAAQALAIRTGAGEHGLLLAEDVEVVDAEQRRVAVRAGARLLALEPPRLLTGSDGNARLHASWTTSGASLPLPGPHPPGTLSEYIPRPHLPHGPKKERSDIRTFAVTVGTLYGVILFLIGALIAVDFLAALLFAGRAY